MRSTLHDLANVLAGVRGILDLNQPGHPFNERDRQRLEAVVDEGVATLERCRHMAMATLPDGTLEPGPDWRDLLLEDLQPMGTLFRCQVQLGFEGSPAWDQWPGRQLRSYVRAVTRQVLPHAKGGTLVLRLEAGVDAWTLHWSPVPALPEQLLPGPEERSLDTCSRWALQVGTSLGVALTCADGVLSVRIPRQARR